MYVGDGSGASVDFGVVTALPMERDAVVRRLQDSQKVRDEAIDIRTYHLGEVTVSKGSYRVAVVLTSDMGNVDAAAAASDLIRHWDPRYLFMLGIAGGMPRDNLHLGDVVVADQVIEYEYAKELEGTSDIRQRVHRCCPLLLDRVREMSNWRGDIGLPCPASGGERPRLFVGPIASGNKVVASEMARENIRKIHSRILAIEMEGEGVAAAAWQAATPKQVMVVRGISDLADAAKGDSWQEYAAAAAATFFRDFLMSEPIGVSESRKPTGLFVIGQDPDQPDRFYGPS
jgi:nucleoside phosphorylase